MCDTATISNRIVRLGTSSFRQRMEAASRRNYDATKLSRLNRALSSFYRILYTQCNNVTKEDYAFFGPQLHILLDSIRDLHETCKKMPKSFGMEEETMRLGMNYSALHEIDSDIVNFRIKAPKDQELQELMKESTSALKSLAK